MNLTVQQEQSSASHEPPAAPFQAALAFERHDCSVEPAKCSEVHCKKVHLYGKSVYHDNEMCSQMDE